jgi:predicted transcriptional regulator
MATQKRRASDKERTRTVISIPPLLHARLKVMADAGGHKIQWLAEQAIVAYLKRTEARR